jgi:hypothetical protein
VVREGRLHSKVVGHIIETAFGGGRATESIVAHTTAEQCCSRVRGWFRITVVAAVATTIGSSISITVLFPTVLCTAVIFSLAAPPSSVIPIILIFCLLRLDQIHQVGVERTLFDLLPIPIRPLLANPAQTHNLYLAVDIDTPVSPEATEATTAFFVGITKALIVDCVSINAIDR